MLIGSTPSPWTDEVVVSFADSLSMVVVLVGGGWILKIVAPKKREIEGVLL
jgi:hypothetical protein